MFNGFPGMNCFAIKRSSRSGDENPATMLTDKHATPLRVKTVRERRRIFLQPVITIARVIGAFMRLLIAAITCPPR